MFSQWQHRWLFDYSQYHKWFQPPLVHIRTIDLVFITMKVSFTGLRMGRPLEMIKLRLICPVQRNSDVPEPAGWLFSFTNQSLDTDCAGVLQKRMLRMLLLQMKCVLCFSSALDKLWSTLSDAYGAAHVNRVLVPVFWPLYSYISILFKL